MPIYCGNYDNVINYGNYDIVK